MAKLISMLTSVALASTPAVAGSAATSGGDTTAVRAVLGSYQAAVQRLDTRGTQVLFADDSEIFESGGSEGNYKNYLAHHLTPELSEFKSFKFSDYRVSVRFAGPVALASEAYKYRIELKSGEVAERFGVATSVLRKRGGRWQVISMHSSARKPKAP